MARFTVRAFSLLPSARPVSGQGGIYRYLNADLFPIGIDTYLAQQLTRSILAYLCTVDIEQDCKRAAVLYLFIPNVIIYVHG